MKSTIRHHGNVPGIESEVILFWYLVERYDAVNPSHHIEKADASPSFRTHWITISRPIKLSQSVHFHPMNTQNGFHAFWFVKSVHLVDCHQPIVHRMDNVLWSSSCDLIIIFESEPRLTTIRWSVSSSDPFIWWFWVCLIFWIFVLAVFVPSEQTIYCPPGNSWILRGKERREGEVP